MKKVIATTVLVCQLVSTIGISLAQEFYSDPGYVPSGDYSGSYGDTGGYGYTAPSYGSTIYNNDYTGSSYSNSYVGGSNDYGNTFYSDPSYVAPSYGSTVYNYDTSCSWCTNTTNTTTGNDYGNTFYSDSSYVAPAPGSTVYNYDTSCSWCSTPTYTTPTYTSPTYTSPTYDYPTYTSPTYTTPTYTTPTYTTPTYTTPTYTSPVYTTPTYTTPTYTTPTYTYPTYTTPTYTTTPTVTTVPVTTTTICADGTTPNPITGCAHSTTIPVTTTTVCADGSTPNPLTGCTRTTTIPVTTVATCADGLPRNADGTCTRVNTIPTSTITRCSDGSYPVNGSCVRTNIIPATTVTYQSCWDGSTIPLGSVCPAQYKTCPNGTSIPINQMCYYTPSVPYTPPQEVKFNNVITSVATEITRTSARCNGIGLIASGAPSTGWFEYGETPNLGRETAHANIGSSPTAPFSNVLANLKPANTYYCRAVMQNQFGTVKGEVVAFTTKSTTVTYVKPVTTVKATTKVTKTTTEYKASYAPKNEVACVDGTTVKLESKTTAQLLQSGQKLITLDIQKVGGELSPGSAVSYQLTWKNMSDESLRGVTVKVTIPAEITLTNASAGQFDPTTRVLTITQSVLGPTSEGTVTWSGVVTRETEAGKSLATTAYSSYSVPGTNVQDEVTAYTVGSVVPPTNSATTTGAKNVIGASGERGFLPDTLVEWLALIAIIFIIVVLGRSVYTSYKSEKKTVVHH